jgi:hypothetical protein
MISRVSNETFALSLTHKKKTQHRPFLYVATIFFFEIATISKFA